MEQLATYGGSKVITKQGTGSRAGHQLCLPRRRHSPERGKEDTTACPWSRKVKYKVMHSYGAVVWILTVLLLIYYMRPRAPPRKGSTSRQTEELAGKGKDMSDMSWEATRTFP